MTPLEVSHLKNGIYKLYWQDGGSSIAAVGTLHDGTRWFAPINWTAKCEHGIACTDWSDVSSAIQCDVETKKYVVVEHPRPNPLKTFYDPPTQP